MADIKTDIHREKKDRRHDHEKGGTANHVDPKYDRHNSLAEINENHRKEAMNPVQHPT